MSQVSGGKQVYPSAMVAHLWANKSQGSARTASKNMYFEGDTIYSYGSHFPIARHVTDKKFGMQKSLVVLFNNNGYSSATNGHKQDVLRALDGTSALLVFHVNNVRAGTNGDVATDKRHHAENFADYHARVELLVKRASASRKYGESLKLEALALIKQANWYRKLFGVRLKPISEDLSAIAVKVQKETIADKQAKKIAADKKAKLQAAILARYPEYVEQWRNHAVVIDQLYVQELDYMLHDCNTTVQLRMTGDGRSVETSRGALVPAPIAHALWSALRRRHEGFDNNALIGQDVGGFKIEEVRADGSVKIGCHVLTWDAMVAFARHAGWIEQNDATI